MAQKRIVPFISDDKLTHAVGWVVSKTRQAIANVEAKFDRNRVDPFSTIFDSICNGLSYKDWHKKEVGRQIQKTMQNHIGEFHQKIIGGIDGWEDLGVGHMVDARNKEKRIIAEVKNKYNTEKGIHRIAMYDAINYALSKPEHSGFTGYYVTVIGKKKDYHKLFTPSDRESKIRRPENKKIIEISGYLFYDIATGQKDSLYTLFKALPTVLKNQFGYDTKEFTSDEILKEIYNRTYRWGEVPDDEE